MATPPYDLKRPTSYAPAIPAGPTPELRRPTKSRTWILFSSFFFISLILLIIYQSSTTNNPIISPNEVSANVDQSSPAENLTPPPAEVSIGEGGLRFAWTDAMLSWQRTAYHFQPEKNWMNDPNGPLLYKGWYHSFYQYNPDSAVWGNLTWGHAVSRDLIHWLHLPNALVPDQWYDIGGVWTGSATIDSNGQIVMVYTGFSKHGVQVQCVAYPANSSDPLLLEWVKDPRNPVIAPPPGIGDEDFRDPTTAWLNPDGDNWRITIGSKINKTGISFVYETNDFISYKLLEGLLYEVPGTGMWECIDFYPVSLTDADGLDTSANGIGINHVLKISLQDQFVDCYAVGTYDPINNKWTPKDPKFDMGTALRYDYGRFYASKTFYDNDKKRRILLAWVKESNREDLDILKGWSGVQSIPRTVVYDQKTGDNIILQWPVKEVESLRSESFELSDVKLGPGSVVPLQIESTSQLDIFATFEIDKQESLSIAEKDSDYYDCPTSGGAANRGTLGPFGILVLADENLSELTPLYFYLAKGANAKAETHFCVDELRSSEASDVEKLVYGSKVPVLDGERLTIRSLIDHSIVESFAQGGRTVITSRVYPTKSINEGARVFLFNNATGVSVTASIKAWKMESADIHHFPLDQL